ncbi:hypothetical protein CRG98_045877 [Punica granatum]|uniref:Uncharacterized protein n=1 Tax=Punica granatum TaxID=22663 RepID=A0A2I0HR38_PUNGR|nr:hypothetical protein CRG98_045877 [Punica granatum]
MGLLNGPGRGAGRISAPTCGWGFRGMRVKVNISGGTTCVWARVKVTIIGYIVHCGIQKFYGSPRIQFELSGTLHISLRWCFNATL